MPTEQIFDWEGITLPSYWGGNFSNAGGHAAMDQIRDTGASTVTLIPNFFQSNQFSNTVKLNLNSQPFSSESDSFAQVTQAILDAKARGLNVVLKPHLETDNRVWRAEIAPTDTNAWFASYKAMMVEYAKAAQAAGASMICVGTEMKSMSGPQYTDKWVDLIDAVRAVFSGKVTYASTYDEVTKVGFWDAVDFIGVDAYLPLSTSNAPTVDQMITAWTEPHFNSWIRDTLYGGKSAIDYYKALSELHGKQVIFTEVGYRSADGANQDPGVFSGSTAVDNQEQQDCYTALYNVMENYGGQWLGGSFLWSYHAFANPMTDAGVPYTDYTTQWKPANATITQHYSSPIHVTGLTRTGSAVGDKLDGGYHNDVLNGGGGNDILWGGAGRDQPNGGDNNDTLTGGAGDDILQGGAGENTAVFSGTRASYDLVRHTDGTVTVADLRADHDGSDVLTDIRFAKFSDQKFDLTTSEPIPDPDPIPQPHPTPDPQPQPIPPTPPASASLVGTPGPDQLSGRDANEIILGLAGDDALFGGGGKDVIWGDLGNDRMFGDGQDDILYGGRGRDVLNGGAGNDQIWGEFDKDTLSGGSGRDIFAFGTKPSKTAIDRILDFNVKDDTMWFAHTVFKKIGKGSESRPGKLNKAFFTIGAAAKDANDYLVYDPTKKVLYYDADGSAKGAAVAIASFAQKQKLTAADFLVI